MYLTYDGIEVGSDETISITEGQQYNIYCVIEGARPEGILEFQVTYDVYEELTLSENTVTENGASPLLSDTESFVEVIFYRNPNGQSTGTIECTAENDVGNSVASAVIEVFGKNCTDIV